MVLDYKRDYYTKIKPKYLDYDQYMPEFWEMNYSDRWIDILLSLGRNAWESGIEVLDVGCGFGRALEHYKSFKAKVLGVEPGDFPCENSRLSKDEIINLHFENAEIDHKFDVVQFEQVLSHMPNYRECLEKAKYLLKDNGVLVIEEPNDFNALQEVLAFKHGEYWVTDDHVNYFNFHKIENVLDSMGFEIVHKTCTYPMEFFLLMGENYLNDDIAGRRCHAKVYELLKNMGCHNRKKLLETYAQMNLGRDLVVIAKKKGV